MSKETVIIFSTTCAVLGFLSIIASIYIWLRVKFTDPSGAVNVVTVDARAERFAIFVGLWAPSFFALASFFRSIANG